MLSRSKVLLTTIVIASVMALSLLTLPTFAEPGGRVEVGDVFTVGSLKALAFTKVDEDTYRVMNASVTLTVNVTAVRRTIVRLQILEGTIEIDGNTYTVTDGTGAVFAVFGPEEWNPVVLRGTAEDSDSNNDGNNVSFRLQGLVGKPIDHKGVVIAGKGVVKVDETLYGLRFLASVERA